jgi:ATP-dependent exoDNAse (exonuclease V) beta subunit
LNFVNSVFRLVMREEIGGVNYDADAELKFGAAKRSRARLPAGIQRRDRIAFALQKPSPTKLRRRR